MLNNAIGAAAALVALAIVPASALPVTYNFSGTFSDGQTATGNFSLNVYGYPSTPTSITTTTGLFSGFTYAIPGDPSALPSPNTLVLSSPSYNRYLYLNFTNPISNGSADPLLTASSFECDTYGSTTYACTGNASQIRYFSSGMATPVPEPATIWILLAPLAGVSAAVALTKRKRTALA